MDRRRLMTMVHREPPEYTPVTVAYIDCNASHGGANGADVINGGVYNSYAQTNGMLIKVPIIKNTMWMTTAEGEIRCDGEIYIPLTEPGLYRLTLTRLGNSAAVDAQQTVEAILLSTDGEVIAAASAVDNAMNTEGEYTLIVSGLIVPNTCECKLMIRGHGDIVGMIALTCVTLDWMREEK